VEVNKPNENEQAKWTKTEVTSSTGVGETGAGETGAGETDGRAEPAEFSVHFADEADGYSDGCGEVSRIFASTPDHASGCKLSATLKTSSRGPRRPPANGLWLLPTSDT